MENGCKTIQNVELTRHMESATFKNRVTGAGVPEKQHNISDAFSKDFLEIAERCRKILKVDPENANVLHLCGVVQLRKGEAQTAADFFSKAIRNDPTNPAYYINLGRAMRGLGKTTGAVSCFQKAIQLTPGSFEAHFELGDVLENDERHVEALSCYERAAALRPDDYQIHIKKGHVLKTLGKLREAFTVYRNLLVTHPDKSETYHHMALVFFEKKEFDKVIQCYQKAVQLTPDHHLPYLMMGNAFESQKKLDQALKSYQKSIRIKPDNPLAYMDMGGTYWRMGNLTSALDSFRRACRLKTDFAEAHSNLLMAMQYDPKTTEKTIFDESNRWWDNHGRPHFRNISKGYVEKQPSHLKIGYVSPDLRKHSVAWFFLPLIENHDPDCFETFCYSNVKKPDAVTAQIRKCCHHWRTTVDISGDAVAKQVQEDHIDILVDLAGHTRDNRLDVFAGKPAPIQVTWLGYPGTTGMQAMDYRITDVISDPPGEADLFHCEKLIRLPDGFLCYSPPENCPEVSTPPADKNGWITFGTFNNQPKINNRLVSLWANIMHCLPESRFLIKNEQIADRATRENAVALFQQHGISADRLQIIGRASTVFEHLKNYNKMDIALDTFPYNGTTTTFEALWMGVPVVTLSGKRHASRVGASIMTHIGLKEFIAMTERQYIDKAVGLARDLELLASLRKRMRGKMGRSPLSNPASFARKMEKAYRKMFAELYR